MSLLFGAKIIDFKFYWKRLKNVPKVKTSRVFGILNMTRVLIQRAFFRGVK